MMKTRERNKLIQKMLEFAHIQKDELTVIDYSEGSWCLDITVKRKNWRNKKEMEPGQIDIRLSNDGWCAWINNPLNQGFNAQVDFSYKP